MGQSEDHENGDYLTFTFLRHFYHQMVPIKGDPRLNHLPLMDNPMVNTISVCIYLFIVKYAGPKFMENRKPFEFRRILFVYNIGLVVLSAWMFYEFLAAGWWNDYSFECEECDYSDTPRNRRMINVTWVFWISKAH